MKARRFRKAKRAEGTIRQEVYLPVDLAAAIDEFKHARQIPARPEAIRRLCEIGLKANDLLATIDGLRVLAGMRAAAFFKSNKTRQSRRVRGVCGQAGRIDIADDNLFGG